MKFTVQISNTEPFKVDTTKCHSSTRLHGTIKTPGKKGQWTWWRGHISLSLSFHTFDFFQVSNGEHYFVVKMKSKLM